MNTNGNRDDHEHQAFVQARERMIGAPWELTPDDFTQLQRVSPILVEQAHQLRRAATKGDTSGRQS